MPDPQKNFEQKGPSAFAHLERHVALQLGLNKDEARELRQKHLIENTHFVRLKKHVVYNEEGLALIKKAATLPGPAPTENEAQGSIPVDPAPIQAPVPVTLKAFMAAHHNPYILIAYKPDTDPNDPKNRVRVRVRSNVNFTRGMDLPAWHEKDDLYALARPCPRSRGRW